MLTAALAVMSPFARADCEAVSAEPGTKRPMSEAWGTDHAGQRYQPATRTSINADNAATLQLKWVYGFSTDKPRSYPLVTEDTIFIGDGERGLVALDRETGCLRWENTSMPDVATAIIPARIDGQLVLVFAEREAGVHAVDARTGEKLWTQPFENMEEPMFSGSPLVYKDVVYVPLSSREIGLALNPLYECCRTSGGVVALDVRSGKQRWYRPTIDEPVRETGKHLLVVSEYGPSGAPVWNTPTLDAEQGRLYFGTGQNYSLPATLTSDAIFSVHSENGEVDWVRQFTANDTYNLSCEASTNHPNCPNPVGPDLDFGAPPILYERADGKRLLFAGQKSGDVYALDAVTGDTLWTRRIGRGGKLGGIHWGMALDPQSGQLFVPVSDVGDRGGELRQPGVFALDVADGSMRWSAERDARCEERKCWPGISAAIAAGPGIVVSGGMDGLLQINRSKDGATLWSYETTRSFTAVNGVETAGGVIDAHGPMLAGDLLIVASGYGTFSQEGGNALLVFALPQ